MNTLTGQEIGWLAGIIEGEGSLHVNKRNEPKVNVSMTDFDVVRALGDLTGVGRVSGPFKRENPRHKPIYHWTVNKSSDVVDIVKLILPLLHERRSLQALKCLIAAEDSLGRQAEKKRFCAKGHDKDVVGRTKLNQCVPCTRKSWRDSYHRNKVKKQEVS